MSSSATTPRTPPNVARLRLMLGHLSAGIGALPLEDQDRVAVEVLARIETPLLAAVRHVEPRFVDADLSETREQNDRLYESMFPGSPPVADNVIALADDQSANNPEAQKKAEWDRLADEMDRTGGTS